MDKANTITVTNPIKVQADSWRDFFYGDAQQRTTGWERFWRHKVANWELQASDTVRYAEEALLEAPTRALNATAGLAGSLGLMAAEAEQWLRGKLGAWNAAGGAS